MKLCMGCMQQYEEMLHVCPWCGYEENLLPEEAFHLLPGTSIGGRYIVGRALGSGGFGITYIGYDKKFERRVAIKEYLPSEFATRTLHQTRVTVYSGDKLEQFRLGMERFSEEARKLAKFGGDKEIVNVYETFTENDTAYIVMEYLEGESLKQLLEKKGKLSLEETEQILLPVIRALKPVHDEGIVHRDIAPDNIFITKDGKVKLLDFGAARYAAAMHSRSLTVIYKPGYAPEEQYQSRGELGPWTDVYALAATLYRCITGITPDTSLERRVKDTLKPPSKLGVQISKNKETALMNALNIQVKSRTKSTEEFLKEWESKGEVIRIAEKFKKIDTGKLSKKAKIGIVSGIVVLAAGLAVGIGLGGITKIVDSIRTSGRNVRVPSVVNKTFEEAVLLSEKAGISLVQNGTEYDANIEKGRVLSQSVEAGHFMDSSESLEVVVSGGIRQIYVPGLAGSSEKKALEKLEEEGFRYKVVKEWSDNAEAEGTVIRTSPSDGTRCDKGTEITVYISKGVNPASIEKKVTYVVEDYTNKAVDEVKEILARYGIELNYTDQAESDEVAENHIISQSTPVGKQLVSGDTVTVVMSLGIPSVNVEGILGRQYTEVKERLEEDGLILTKTEVYHSNKAKGLIISAQTAAGETVTDDMFIKKGTEIVCTVSKGAKPSAKATTAPKATKAAVSTPTPTPKVLSGKKIKWAEEGSIISIGQYEQDNNTENGKELLEWIVLKVEEDRLLVVSRYCLDAAPYDTENATDGWTDSSLRAWLNGEFYEEAFSGKERISILSTKVGEGEAATQERVFLLSTEEAEEYFAKEGDRKAEATEYAVGRGISVSSVQENKGCCEWWLRSDGKMEKTAVTVLESGSIRKTGRTLQLKMIGVRPVMWIDKE